MANKKISELLQSTSITGEELIPFVLDGQNKVVKAKYLKGADNLGEDYVDIVGDDGNTYRLHVVNGEVVSKTMWEWGKFIFLELRLRQAKDNLEDEQEKK